MVAATAESIATRTGSPRRRSLSEGVVEVARVVERPAEASRVIERVKELDEVVIRQQLHRSEAVDAVLLEDGHEHVHLNT